MAWALLNSVMVGALTYAAMIAGYVWYVWRLGRVGWGRDRPDEPLSPAVRMLTPSRASGGRHG